MDRTTRQKETFILGAGVTGLAAGFASGFSVLEQASFPGGICASYYLHQGKRQRMPSPPQDDAAYRFEIGGGHWIFGGDSSVLRFMSSLTPIEAYNRRAAVYFTRQQRSVPYPLQYHLRFLDQSEAAKALSEMTATRTGQPRTMAEWLLHHFGRTLTDAFFGPFHERYTDGLWTEIVPQDAYKSPIVQSEVVKGMSRQTAPAGYNVVFHYPHKGLSDLLRSIAARVPIHYGQRVIGIDVRRKELNMSDGRVLPYQTVIATIPLNCLVSLTGLLVEEEPDPFTSVLVLNIGARKGRMCPADHWLYIPDSQAGFYRVGFYSNVSRGFLPRSVRTADTHVALYVERAYRNGYKPSDAVISSYTQQVVQELREWGFISDVELVDPTWVEVAYTWTRPGSRWRDRAIPLLEQHDIYPVGRYARWMFQGIADSMRDGFVAGSSLGGFR